MTYEELKKELPVIKQKLESGEYSVVSIDGPQGPTGKTTAANFLREQGVPVFEEWQMLNVQIGWNPKHKTSIMTWPQFVHDVGRLCDMIRKGRNGYQAIIVSGTHRVKDALEILQEQDVIAYEECEVLRLEFADYISPAMQRPNFQIC